MPEHPLSELQRLDPQMTAYLNETNDLVYAAGVLSKKIKLLLAMVFDTAQGAEFGVRALYRFGRIEGPCLNVGSTLLSATTLSGTVGP